MSSIDIGTYSPVLRDASGDPSHGDLWRAAMEDDEAGDWVRLDEHMLAIETLNEAHMVTLNLQANRIRALEAELAGYKESHDKHCPSAERVRVLAAALRDIRDNSVYSSFWAKERAAKALAAPETKPEPQLCDWQYNMAHYYDHSVCENCDLLVKDHAQLPEDHTYARSSPTGGGKP